ncbi:MAG: leucine-rich repeat domain-containing protein [Muribaculaceae bacterium]
MTNLFYKIAIVAALAGAFSFNAKADSFEERDSITYYLNDSSGTAEAISTTKKGGEAVIKSVVTIEVDDPQNPGKKITKSYTVTAVSGFMSINISSVSIPSTVTVVKARAFNGCTKLRDVTLPAGLRLLGNSSFSGCVSLKEVSVPVGCVVDDFAFNGCTSLQTVTSAGVDSIGNSAFSGCTELTQALNLPAKSGTFIYSGCSSLRNKPITENGIPKGTFSNCTSLVVTDIRMLDGAEIGEMAFMGCTSITEVYIDGAPVGDGAFGGCTSLSKVEFGETQTVIGASAFSSCPLEQVICNATTPPVAYFEGTAGSAFSSLHYSSATLYVPANWLNLYATTEPWKNFLNIKTLADAGVGRVMDDKRSIAVAVENGCINLLGADESMLVDVYNVDGSLVHSISAGNLRHTPVPVGNYVVRSPLGAAKVAVH